MCLMHKKRVAKHGDPHYQRPRGAGCHHWKGDNVTYSGAHQRVRRARGRASEHQCLDCGVMKADHWAYDHSDPNEMYELRGHSGSRYEMPYSADPERYLALCAPCHRRLDRDKKDKGEIHS